MGQLLALALQFQCGFQTIGDATLAYGTLVYLEPDSTTPKVAFFSQYQNQAQKHPFCAVIGKALPQSKILQINVDESTKELTSVSVLKNSAR